MSSLLKCLKLRREPPEGDSEPLFDRHDNDDDVTRQHQLRQKLHSYQKMRALSQGYMPSTEQIIANLRAVIASDVIRLHPDLSNSGRQLVRDIKIFLNSFIELLRDKNNDDQFQDFLWHFSKSKVSLDTSELLSQASAAKAGADTRAAYHSIRTVGSLLLTNADFRLFLDDITTVGRQIFADTAYSLSEAAEEVGKNAEQSQKELDGAQGSGPGQKLSEIAASADEAATKVGQKAQESAQINLAGQQKDVLLGHLKQTVLKLRKRSDYSDSVSVLSRLITQYGKIYSHAAEDLANMAKDDIDVSPDLRESVDRFWKFVRLFGNEEEWEELEARFHQMMTHANRDPEFEKLISEIGSSVQDMLGDPEFFDHASERIGILKEKTKSIGDGSSLRADIDSFLAQLKSALQTIPQDPALEKIIASSKKIIQHLLEAYNNKTSTLVADLVHVFLPLLIRAVQHVPIPRLEISSPEMDLLLENLVLEPGHTVNASSFFPYKVQVASRIDMELAKVHSKKATTSIKQMMTVSVTGLNVSAADFGYWIHAHSNPLLHFRDEGIASFYLDQRGIDLSVDIEIGRGRLSQMVTLRGVRVHIHKLDYTVQKSRWKYLLWVFKPFLKQLVRRALEKKIAEYLVETIGSINRELVFARERLRAVTVANPKDWSTFIHAVLARPKSRPDNLQTSLRARSPGGYGIFKDVYAPGSIVKVWEEEVERAQDALENGDESEGFHLTWRNSVFDLIP